MNTQLFKVPADQQGAQGIFIGGGWHTFSDDDTHGRVLLLPATGDYSTLVTLGFVSVATPTQPQDQ